MNLTVVMEGMWRTHEPSEVCTCGIHVNDLKLVEVGSRYPRIILLLPALCDELSSTGQTMNPVEFRKNMDSAARTSKEERTGKSPLQSMHDHSQILDELEIEIRQIGLCVGQHEKKIEDLISLQSELKKRTTAFQGNLDLILINGPTFGQGLVTERIALKTDTAAAVVVQFAQSSAFYLNQWDFAKNILGVVACVGSVRIDSLSRILAHYLGEHQMLGLVCKSLDEASRLVNNGSIRDFSGLDAVAALLGMPVPKSYHVYCIENIPPYTGSVSTDFRRELLFPSPVLPSGECPPGFVGHAVNMIELGAKFRPWRTASGHGLRETLLYHLFGELQVYESRDAMWSSKSCIKEDGAVSLDGGVLRGNGVSSLVSLGEVDIMFPVCPAAVLSPQESYFVTGIERMTDTLTGVNDDLVREQAQLKEALEKFEEKKSRFISLLPGTSQIKQEE